MRLNSRDLSWQVIISALLRRGMVLIVLVALMVYFTSQSDRFLQQRNLINILEQNAALIIITVGMTLTMLIAGIDLSVGSVAALAGAISAGLIVNNGLPFGVSVVITLAMGFGIGLINGSLIIWGKLPPFIATLAMLGIGRGLTLVYTEGRPISLNGVEEYTFYGRGDVVLPLLGEIPVSVLVALAVVIISGVVLSTTRFGLHVYAIGGNEETARLAGVPVNRVKMIAYGSSGMLAALGGMLLTARLFSAQPQAAVGLELDAIAAAVLGGVSLFGGVGNVFGAVTGGLLVGVLSNGMNLLRLASFLQQMIQGVVLVLAVAVDMITKRVEGL
ncbi:MAG: ABC transporter permease [Anaerolineae bacterium]|nr:ABC transporter permease [Anaerolineae bacterium]